MIIQRLSSIRVKFLSSGLNRNAFRTKPLLVVFRNKTSSDLAEHYKYVEGVIGNREMVGQGWNGQPIYADLVTFPFPSIRYKETTPEIMALREKEKGDWRLLTIKEKKELYRSSYCQTFAEFTFVSSEWMYIVGYTLIFVSLGVWLYIFMVACIYDPYPDSFSFDSRMAQLRRLINLRHNPIFGISSNWDYEKMDWKVKTSSTPINPFPDEEDEKEQQ